MIIDPGLKEYQCDDSRRFSHYPYSLSFSLKFMCDTINAGYMGIPNYQAMTVEEIEEYIISNFKIMARGFAEMLHFHATNWPQEESVNVK